MSISDEPGKCGRCNAPVMWVSTVNGKRIALDREPERGYVLDAGTDPMIARQRNVYTCHFDTCRKKEKAAAQ